MKRKFQGIQKLIALLLAALLVTGGGYMLSGCSTTKKPIIIYSTGDEGWNDYMQEELNKTFPEYEITLTYIDTGTLAAKLLTEGTDIEADIIMALESTYIKKCSDSLAKLDGFDFSVYMDELVDASHKYVPAAFCTGTIAVDSRALEQRGLPLPTSYQDLLKPEYRGLISMPNPKSSGTGYTFLLSLVNAWGEDEAFEYFDKLAENLAGQGFTTSGSSPIKSLITKEAAIAFGITYYAVEKINEGNDLDLLFFDEGAPYTSYSNGIVDGRQNDEDIMEVFKYICGDLGQRTQERYIPEPIRKGQRNETENYPSDIPYSDMTGIDDIELKERLLDKWNH